MDGTPRFEIIILDNENFIAVRDPNADPQSIRLFPLPEGPGRVRRHPWALTAGIVTLGSIFNFVFLMLVKLFALSDTQSVIVAISLAAVLVALFVVWFPQRERLIVALLRRVLRLSEDK